MAAIAAHKAQHKTAEPIVDHTLQAANKNAIFQRVIQKFSAPTVKSDLFQAASYIPKAFGNWDALHVLAKPIQCAANEETALLHKLVAEVVKAYKIVAGRPGDARFNNLDANEKGLMTHMSAIFVRAKIRHDLAPLIKVGIKDVVSEMRVQAPVWLERITKAHHEGLALLINEMQAVIEKIRKLPLADLLLINGYMQTKFVELKRDDPSLAVIKKALVNNSEAAGILDFLEDTAEKETAGNNEHAHPAEVMDCLAEFNSYAGHVIGFQIQKLKQKGGTGKNTRYN